MVMRRRVAATIEKVVDRRKIEAYTMIDCPQCGYRYHRANPVCPQCKASTPNVKF